ncbi:hypothetical protein NDI49_04840 [Trichocoleus sp. ST-U3]|uniref:hypothetical protein n=1 Tax=Coleofasciculus sp. FACHB-542 TaxID=2692787 RepID=UPI0016875987|nr:hypothetical protein [Coleofasciculus sp. FACHB-542]MBD2087004.1 hypothetical protein [Coleofasciculus sp. FACHB-542]
MEWAIAFLWSCEDVEDKGEEKVIDAQGCKNSKILTAIAPLPSKRSIFDDQLTPPRPAAIALKAPK